MKLKSEMEKYGSLRDWGAALGVSHEGLRQTFKKARPEELAVLRFRVMGIMKLISRNRFQA
jgi:hypothetical protein